MYLHVSWVLIYNDRTYGEPIGTNCDFYISLSSVMTEKTNLVLYNSRGEKLMAYEPFWNWSISFDTSLNDQICNNFVAPNTDNKEFTSQMLSFFQLFISKCFPRGSEMTIFSHTNAGTGHIISYGYWIY